MTIEVRTADTNGKFSIAAGVGYLVIPWDAGAIMPLEAHINGDVSSYDVVDEERPVYRDAFSKVEFWGATPNSQWLVYTAKSSADMFGGALASTKVQRIARLTVPDSTVLAAGFNYFNADGSNVQLNSLRLFDLRRYRGVKVDATFEQFDPGSTGSIRLALALYRDNQNIATQTPLFLYGGTLANMAGAYNNTWIHVSEQIATVSGNNYTHQNGRWLYAAPFIYVTGGTLTTTGMVQVDLLGDSVTMAQASADERAAMTRAEANLSEQVLAAEAWALAVRVQFFTTDAQKAALKAIADERKRFDTWRTVWKQWALQGQEPDGYSYPVSFWLRIGDDIASALKNYSGNLYKGSLLAVAVNTAGETAHQVVTPSAWPTWLKVTVGVGAAVVVLVVVNNIAGIARNLRG